MKNLSVNFDEIQIAMEDVLRDCFEYYLDTETGKVIQVSENIIDEVRKRLSMDDNDPDEIPEDVEYIEFDSEPEIPDWMHDEMENLFEIVLDNTDRYVRIPERDRFTAYKTMQEFIDTLNDEDLKEKLMIALDGKRAFRRFKDVLIEYPKERKKWHAFNAKKMRKEITDWLETLGIKPL